MRSPWGLYSDRANHTPLHPLRLGDISSINVDPVDGSFWAANEYATGATDPGTGTFWSNWATRIAHFSVNFLTASATAALGAWPTGVVAGDFNGDGKQDMAIANYYDNTVRVLLGNGDGTFHTAPPVPALPANSRPFGIAAGNLTNSGHLDIVTANFGNPSSANTGENVGVFLGNGDGTFQAPMLFASTTSDAVHRVWQVAVGQFRTGHQDIVATSGDGTYTIILSNGDGSFKDTTAVTGASTGVTLPTPTINVLSTNGFLASGSIAIQTGPSTLTLVSYTARTPTAFTGATGGTGTLAINQPVMQATVISAASNNVTLPTGTINVTSTSGFTSAGRILIQVAPGGLAVVSYTGITATSFTGCTGGTGTLQTGDVVAQMPPVIGTPAQLKGIAIANLGDPYPDLVVVNYAGNNVGVIKGNGDGTFQASAFNNVVGDTDEFLATGDFNGDGNVDVATSNNGYVTHVSSISILLGNGNGTFRAGATPTYATGSKPLGITVSDVNQDGDLDIINAGYGSGSIAVLIGNGDGSFRAAQTFALGPGPFGVAAADFNGDGFPDIATTNFNGGSSSVTVGTTAATSVPRITSVTPGQGSVGTSVTLNGVNSLDLLSVLFNGIAVPFGDIVVNGSRTTITVHVPAGATTGLIKVIAAGGIGVSTTPFVVS